MSPRDYASVPERITWTTGFRIPTDKLVLGALSTFANFKTGDGARPSVDMLIARSGLPRRTVMRALRRLERDHWIKGTRRHRHATTWAINVERLATNWVGAKVIESITNLSATGGTQTAPVVENLSATGGTQSLDLSATGGTQNLDLSATGGTPIPCTYGSPVDLIPGRSTGAGAPAFTQTENPDGQEGESADSNLSALPASLRDRAVGDPIEPDGGHSFPPGSDQAATPGTEIQLRPGADPSGPARDHRPRPPVGPYQPTLGPLDVSPPSAEAEHRQQHWTRVGEIFKEALERKKHG